MATSARRVAEAALGSSEEEAEDAAERRRRQGMLEAKAREEAAKAEALATELAEAKARSLQLEERTDELQKCLIDGVEGWRPCSKAACEPAVIARRIARALLTSAARGGAGSSDDDFASAASDRAAGASI